MSASYFLSPHVHLCVAGKQVVLLDLERDKYLSLAHAHPIGRWVRGWPVAAAAAPAAGDGAGAGGAANGLLAKMISQGLLVTDPALGKEASPVAAQPPRLAIVEYDLHARPRTTAAQLWRLFKAHAAAKWSLKYRPIKEVVRLAGLREKRVQQLVTDPATVRPLVTAFVHLRPLFYTVREACLLDSLTLVNFLAGYGVFPQWVFGVKTDPFLAHCWVQHGDFVFNDTPDHVRGYSPILVV